MKNKHGLAAGLALLLALGAAAETPAPIPAAHFANALGLERPVLAPDGGRVAGMVRTDKQRALLVQNTDGSQPRILLRLDKPEFDAQLLRWMGKDRLLLRLISYQPTAVAGERLPASRLLVIDANSGAQRVLREGKSSLWLNHLSREVPQACPNSDHVLLSVQSENREREHGVDRIEGRTGKVERVMRLPHKGNEVRWWADAQGRVRLAERVAADGSRHWLRLQPGPIGLDSWQTWRELPAAQADRFKVLGFDRDPQQLLVEQFENGRATVQRLRLDVVDATPERLAELPPNERVTRLLRHEGHCGAVGVDTESGQQFWADELPALLAGIRDALPGQDWRLSQWQGGGRYLVHSHHLATPTNHMVGDRTAGTLSALALSHSRLPDDLGLRVRALPGGSRLLSPGGVDGAAPLVVCLQCELHRDDKAGGFAPLAALLATRGYRVLLPELKHSGTLPKLSAGIARELDPLVQALVAQGLVQEERIAVIGGNGSGAYGALRWAQQRQQPLRAVITLGALTDLRSYAEVALGRTVTAGYRDRVMRQLEQGRGTALDADSPLQQAASTRAPTLMLHGDTDAGIRIEHSRDFAKALATLGIAHQLIEFAESDSQLDHPPYRRQAAEAIEAWLAQYL